VEWEGHITKLTAEGSDAFQQMYRMEYNEFLKLCTIIHPKVRVNDEMSRHRTVMGSITVEIMLHSSLMVRWWQLS